MSPFTVIYGWMEKSALHVLKVVREAFDTKCLRLSLTQPAALFWRFNTGLEFILKKVIYVNV